MHGDILEDCIEITQPGYLCLRKLYHAKLVVLVEYRLDGGGLSAATVAVQQRILRREPVQKRDGILYNLVALELVVL